METSPSPSSIADERIVSDTQELFCHVDQGVHPSKIDTDIDEIIYLGYSIYIGGNAASNDKLVAQHEHRNCIWMHATCAKGAHIILCWEGKEMPPLEVMRRAAGLALKHSKAMSNEVSFAPLLDVFRPDKSKIGHFVTWRTQTIQL